MRGIFVTATAACLAACGSGAGQMITNVQQDSKPQGIIEGRVLDAATGAPVVGASVQTYADATLMPVSSATDTNGRYALGPLPAGSDYTLYVNGAGYVKRIVSGVGLNGAAGMYPVGNAVTTVDIDMAKGDATINGEVITSTTHAAVNASVFADLRPSGFDLVYTAKTDMTGKFSFANVPGSASGLNVVVNVAPYDENGDGMPDYTATSQSFRMYPGFITTGTITLNSAGVTLVQSNISDGDLGPMEAISLTFASPIVPAQSMITLRSNNTGLNVGITSTWDTTNTVLTVTPVGGALVLGQQYVLNYTLRTASGAQTVGNIAFIVRPMTTMPPTATVANLRVTSPAMMKYDYSTSSVSLAWDMPADVGGYRIYGKDTSASPVYLALTTLNNPQQTTTNVSLSSYFGSNNQALSFGNHITLAVVVLDKAGNEAALTMAPTVDLMDNTIPMVSYAQLLGVTANNLSGSTPLMINYQVTFTEPMLASVQPTLALNNAAVTFTFMWVTATTGQYNLTVPAGQDGRGATMISGAKDTSGNLVMTYNGSLN
jgi:hypothetical protein